MPLSAVDAIDPALQHAKQQLLLPFRFTQWARLAFVGLLAGEMGSGGCNLRFNWPTSHGGRASAHLVGTGLPPELTQHPAISVGLIVLLVVVGFGLVVLFTYIASVMRFILFDSIVARECHIRLGWARRKPHGIRLFRWQILFMLASLAGLVIMLGIPLLCVWAFGWFAHPREHLLALLLGGGILFLLLLALAVLLGVVHVMTKDFVVPQMALEDIGAVEGWRRLLARLRVEKSKYAGYIGMKMVLAIGAAIVFGIITLVALLVLLVPVGGVAVVAVLAGKVSALSWNAHTIALAVVLGCIALAIFLSLCSLVWVPAIVFFPAFSIYFFAARYSPLATLLSPPHPTSAALHSPSQEPPPLPPTPAPSG